jgi:hypothetical protein
MVDLYKDIGESHDMATNSSLCHETFQIIIFQEVGFVVTNSDSVTIRGRHLKIVIFNEVGLVSHN